MAASSARVRVRRDLVAALILVVWMSGCGLGADRPPTLAAADVARALEPATGITLRATPPPSGTPGLPELATSLSGSTTGESLTVLVFFEAEGTRRVLGSGGKPAGVAVLTRSNIVVLYRVSPGTVDQSRQIRQALAAIIVRA